MGQTKGVSPYVGGHYEFGGFGWSLKQWPVPAVWQAPYTVSVEEAASGGHVVGGYQAIIGAPE
jgi:hypothetical protein